MILHEYTVSALGLLVNHREHDVAGMARGAVESAGRLLDQHGNNFQIRLPLPGSGHIELHWKSDDFSCAIATFSADDAMLSTDVILSGLRPVADQTVQAAVQRMIQDLGDSAGEPASNGLARASERPAIACVRWSTSDDSKAMKLVRDIEVCLAAAFVERAFQAIKFLV